MFGCWLVVAAVFSLCASNLLVDGFIQTDKICPHKNTYYPHESECDMFYKCDNFRLVLFHCYPGLHFNLEKKVCDFPVAVKCEYSVCEASSPAPICQEWTKSNPDTFLAHQNTCSLYYKCVFGISYLNECPEGLHFSPKTNKCETPDVADCKCRDSNIY